MDHNEFLKLKFSMMKPVKDMGIGTGFGEIALITKQRRTASIVCKKDTACMVLTKAGYDAIIGAYETNLVK